MVDVGNVCEESVMDREVTDEETWQSARGREIASWNAESGAWMSSGIERRWASQCASTAAQSIST